MKIEEKTTDIAKILEIAKANGIKETRLDKAATSSFLPEKGKFVSWAIEGEAEAEINGKKVDTRHIRLITDGGHSISVSSLQGAGFDGVPVLEEGKDIRYSEKAGYYLRRNCTVNEDLQGNQAAVVAKLVGKTFQTEKKELQVSTFVEGGCQSIEDVEVKPKTFYKITVK